MTRRGRSVLALGVATYLAAWAFGSRPLYPVATGLLLALVVAWAWVRLASGPVTLRRLTGVRDRFEGDDVPVELEVALESRLRPAAVTVVETLSGLAERRVALRPSGRARYSLGAVRRGRYRFEPALVVVEDAFSLWRSTLTVSTGGAVVVYPRLVELDGLFSDSGSHEHEGRRLLLRRPSGFDLHSVREYERGESLRKVHWPTTARRGQLMVKELEDAPRDELAVVLDTDAGAVVGESFEVQVRAAGSVLRAFTRRGRRALLLVSADVPQQQRVHSGEGDWRVALELLAGVEPGPAPPLAQVLARETAATVAELCIVTARLDQRLADLLVQRSASRRRVALVLVDTASFAGRRSPPDPELLRLSRAGVAVAVVRRGDDLGSALGGRARREAHG